MFERVFSLTVHWLSGSWLLMLGMLWPELDAVSYGWRLLFGALFGHAAAGMRCGILWPAGAF